MSSRTKKSVSLKPRSPVSLLAYRIIQFFPRNFDRVLLFLWNSRQFRVISKALKYGCFFCFARLMSEFLTVGRSWSGSFIPPYRSVVTRCAAISLESPLFHRDRARCSRAENGALWKTSYAIYGKRVPTRTKVHADPVHTMMLCARLVCRRFVSFRDRPFFFFSRFFQGKRQIFRVWQCLRTFVVLQS